MKCIFLSIAVFVSYSPAQPSVLLQTDFNQLPQGWVNDEEWVFGSFGAALCVSIQENTWSGEFGTEGEPPVVYFVPDGTDSVVISVDHWILLSAGNVLSTASSAGMIQLWTTHSGWGDNIFYHSVSDSLYSQETISTFVLNSVLPGTYLGFRFRGELVSDSQSNYAEIVWQISQMTVTAYGEALNLTRNTWGGIKASL